MKLLRFLNLLDRDKLSFTNIAFIIVLVKMATSPLDYTGVAALIPVMALYAHKRYENNKTQGHVSDEAIKTQEKVNSALEEKVTKIDLQMGQLAIDAQEFQRVTEEAKKIISNSNLASAFQKR